MTLLSVRNLSVVLETPEGPAAILQDVDFDLAAGESLGLVGESGCGKTMTALGPLGRLPEGGQPAGRILSGGATPRRPPERSRSGRGGPAPPLGMIGKTAGVDRGGEYLVN